MHKSVRARQYLGQITAASLVAAAFAVSSAGAADPIELDVQAGAQQLHVGGSSIPDLVQDVVAARNQFAFLQSAPFATAQLKALGVANAITVDIQQVSANAFTARLRTIAGLDRTFSGPSRDAVEDQITDFLEKDGTSELAKLLAYLNANSPLSVNSGNPNASDAITAQTTFESYGFLESQTNAESDSDEVPPPTYELSLLGDVGFIESRGLKATSWTVPISFSIFESRRWGVRMQIPLNYTSIEGAEIYRMGLNLAAPIKIIMSTPEEKTPWLWQVTPSGGTQATASKDLVAGGILNNVSLSSALEYNLGPDYHNISIGMGNQITAVESLELSVSDYTFDPDVSSRILKNGVKVSLPFARHFVFDIYAIDSRFIGGDTYSDGYETIGGTVGYRRAKGPTLRLGAYSNFSKDYSSVNVQVGAGWKF